MIRRIQPIVKKEFRQIVRDRASLAVLLFIPAFMLAMFGYALNFDVKHISLAVYDESKTQESRAFIQNFLHSEYFDLKYYVGTKNEIDALLGSETVRCGLVIPQDFAGNIAEGRTVSVQVLVDGANASAAATAVGYLNAITQDYSNKILLETLARNGKNNLSLPIDARPRVWYNPELQSAKFLVPGLIGFILMITSVVSTSLSIVREKERGTMEQLIVSPVNSLELVIGKTIPYVLISLVAALAVLFAGYWLFGVEVRGSYMLLFGVTLLFIVAALGMGLFISTIADTQQVAFTIATLITILPTFTLSGFVFPIENMPFPIQVVTNLFPARFYLSALRAIILKGVGLEAMWLHVVKLAVFAFFMLGISALRMRKKYL